MAKKTMTVLAVFLIIRGFLSLVPSVTWASEEQWLGMIEIALGLVALGLNNLKRSTS